MRVGPRTAIGTIVAAAIAWAGLGIGRTTPREAATSGPPNGVGGQTSRAEHAITARLLGARERLDRLGEWVEAAEAVEANPARMCPGCRLLLSVDELRAIRAKAMAHPEPNAEAGLPGPEFVESLTLRERTFLEQAGMFDPTSAFLPREERLVARPEDHAEFVPRDPDSIGSDAGVALEAMPYGEH